MINNDFKYCVEWLDKGRYDCENHGCNDEGICRCYQIESVEINHISIRKVTDQIFRDLFDIGSDSWKREQKLFDLIYDTDLDMLYFWQYCINRILTINKVWNKSNWSPKWSGGYYGDEIDSISIKKSVFDKINLELSKIQSIATLPGIIQHLITLEYGHLLDKLLNKNYTIKEVDVDDIYFPQDKHYQKVLSKDLSYLEDSREDDIQGICLEENNKYNVVDGYHRLTYFKKTRPLNNKITIISIC